MFRRTRKTNRIFHGWFKSIIVVIILVSIGIIIYNSVGFYDSEINSAKMFESPELSDSDVINTYKDYESYLSDQYWLFGDIKEKNNVKSVEMKDYEKRMEEIMEDDPYSQVEKLEPVDKLLYYCIQDGWQDEFQGERIAYVMSNRATAEFFQYKLSEGKQLTEVEQTSKYPNAVVCGAAFKDVKIGEDIDVIYNTKPKKVHVVGKVAAPYRTLLFRGRADMDLTNYNRIFLLDSKTSLDTFGLEMKRYTSYAFVIYKPGTTEEEKEQCRDFYAKYIYDRINKKVFEQKNETYEDVKVNSYYPFKLFNDLDLLLGWQIKNIVRDCLRYSLIAMFIITAIYAINAKMKEKEFCVLYMCGCTRRRSFLTYFISGATPILISGLIVTAIMLVHSYIIENGLMPDRNYVLMVVGADCYLYVWLAMLAILIVSSIIPYFIITRQNSTLSYLRKKGK